MGKLVKVDEKNRIYITYVEGLKDKDILEIEPNAVSALIFSPDTDKEVLIESLKTHIQHVKTMIKNDES